MFGQHIPIKTRSKPQQSPAATFTRGLQLGGTQWEFRFPNGYGASVIDDGYGGDSGLYELAVLNPDGRLDYSTPITDDVLGWLTAEDVTARLDEIAALTPEGLAEHRAEKERADRNARIAELEAELADLRNAEATR